MDLSSFALRLYESEILIYVRATANARGRVKSHGLSAVFKHRDPTLRASEVYTALRKRLPCYLSTFHRLSFPQRWH